MKATFSTSVAIDGEDLGCVILEKTIDEFPDGCLSDGITIEDSSARCVLQVDSVQYDIGTSKWSVCCFGEELETPKDLIDRVSEYIKAGWKFKIEEHFNDKRLNDDLLLMRIYGPR